MPHSTHAREVCPSQDSFLIKPLLGAAVASIFGFTNCGQILGPFCMGEEGGRVEDNAAAAMDQEPLGGERDAGVSARVALGMKLLEMVAA